MSKFLKSKKVILTWLTLLILSNCLSIFLITHGIVSLPNTIVLSNESSEFLTDLAKLNLLDRLINKSYTGEVDYSAVGEELNKSLFSALGDPYSVYYSADEYDQIFSSYSEVFGGIGVEIDGSNPNSVRISRVIEDTPAQAAGIQAEDVIVKVDGEDVIGQPIDLVVSKTRGEVGTDVVITVERNGELLDFSLKRAKIDKITVRSKDLNGIGYIYISSFGEGTAKQFQKELDALLAEGITGLILDLRSNGGGLVDSAVEVADILLDADLIAYSTDKEGNRQNYTTQNGKVDIPFVVLVDNDTASASELLAGGLQQNGVLILGSQTFGKGVMQAMGQLIDGSGYKLTFQEYFLKDGSTVNKVGITPDIPLEPATELLYDEYGNEIDSNIQEALNILRSQ